MPAPERIPEEGPHFNWSKEVTFIVRIVADEPWIQGKIWGVCKMGNEHRLGRSLSPRSNSLSDER